MLEQKLDDDLKTAMLAGDSVLVTRLRTLKSVLLNKKVADNTRDKALTDDEVIALLVKESKKRQESADFFVQGGSQERADGELAEKALVDAYLPAQMSEDDLIVIIDEAIAATGATTPQEMGKVMGQVKGKAGAGSDGALIAKLVKERLSA